MELLLCEEIWQTGREHGIERGVWSYFIDKEKDMIEHVRDLEL